LFFAWRQLKMNCSGYGTNLGLLDLTMLTFLLGSSPPFCITEGPWSEVSKAIHDCHAAVHAKGAPRVATDIRIGTRVDRQIEPGTGNEGKVQRVRDILAKDV
jgi:uncharacterized protein YqgV (UPF0045/DUF77 family)